MQIVDVAEGEEGSMRIAAVDLSGKTMHGVVEGTIARSPGSGQLPDHGPLAGHWRNRQSPDSMAVRYLRSSARLRRR
jgi:hypothetical protein